MTNKGLKQEIYEQSKKISSLATSMVGSASLGDYAKVSGYAHFLAFELAKLDEYNTKAYWNQLEGSNSHA